MRIKLATVVVAAACFARAGDDPAHASPLEKLLMPGPLIEGHADLEAECAKCHEPFRRGLQPRLCLDCHEPIAADLEERSGFHGRLPASPEIACRECHTDHAGRDADIVGLDVDRFEHDMTDFALEGAHLRVRCSDCHSAAELYRDAPGGCVDCHLADDHHRGGMGTDCGSCHTVDGWTGATFDHGETDYPLTGLHGEVSCAQCHPSARYADTPRDCVSCHAVNDVHGGLRGTDCDSCHKTTSWRDSSFDHGATDFPLTGAHAEVGCTDCHSGNVYEQHLDVGCHSCHRADDQHKGRNGTRCETCHSTSTWRDPLFDHDTDTDFALVDRHREVACASCHTGPLYEAETPTDCNGCHAHDDVHQGAQGTDCETCHSVRGWDEEVAFDHDLSSFPLIGLHALVSCEECHLTAGYKGVETDCVQCHAGDDAHEARLGPGCADCHNPNDWRLWDFDHDTRTDFALDGKHDGLACHACHTTPAEGRVRQSSDCVSCHRADDVHRGGFGRQCDACHGTESFGDIAR